MTEASKRYQFSLRSLLLATLVLTTAFALFRVAYFYDNLPKVVRILAWAGGAWLWTGVMGAAVGHFALRTQAGCGTIIGLIVITVLALLVLLLGGLQSSV